MREPIRTFVISMPVPEHHIDALRDAFPEVTFLTVDQDDLPEALTDVDALAAWGITEDAIQRAERLRWIHRGGAGVEDLVWPVLREREIILTNSSGVHATNIAEHVIAMMLSFARGLPILHRNQRERTWQLERSDLSVFELSGQSVLLLGTGDIGEAAAVRAKALGMTTVGVRRRSAQPRPDGMDSVVSIDRLEEVLGSADHVVSSLPMTPTTRGVMSAAAFAAMKEGGYFYNVGRGGTVDQAALIAALESGRLAGAGLDVTDPEPLPEDSPLWDLPNVILTMHTSGRTPHMWDRVFRLIRINLERYQAGDELLNVVDIDAGY